MKFPDIFYAIYYLQFGHGWEDDKNCFLQNVQHCCSYILATLFEENYSCHYEYIKGS